MNLNSAKFPNSKNFDENAERISNIFLIENNEISRKNLARKILSCGDFKLVGVANYNLKNLDLNILEKPSIVVFSSFLNSKEQLDAIKKLKCDYPKIRPVILTPKPSARGFCEIAKIGARAYCNAKNGLGELVLALRAVAAGKYFYCSELNDFVFQIVNKMVQMPEFCVDKPVEELVCLSPREFEVIQAAKTLGTYQNIADALFISPNTVKMHLTKVYSKLGVKSKLEAILKLEEIAKSSQRAGIQVVFDQIGGGYTIRG